MFVRGTRASSLLLQVNDLSVRVLMLVPPYSQCNYGSLLDMNKAYTLLLLVLFASPLLAVPNLLTNGGFEDGIAGWAHKNWSGAESSLDIVADADMPGATSGILSVTNPGTANWHIQLEQTFSLEAGKTYRVSFLAKAHATRPAWIQIRGNESRTVYITERIELTTSPQEFALEYTAVTNEASTALRLLFGTDATTVVLDDVVLTDEADSGETITDLPDPNPNADPDGPQLDGTIEALWESAGIFAVENEIMVQPDDDHATIGARFRTLWTAEALYVLVEIEDDVLFNQAPQHAQNDMVEIYLDLNNSKSSVYDGIDDDQFRFLPLSRGFSSDRNVTAEQIQFGTAQTDSGWRLEVKLPWSVLTSDPDGFTPQSGQLIGFEIMVGDNDQDVRRRALLGWTAETNIAWRDPSVFGVMRLTETGTTDREPFVIPEIVSDGRPIDEAEIERLVYVDIMHPQATDEANDGTDPDRPFRTIRAALKAVGEPLGKGIATKISVAEGYYPEAGLKPFRPLDPSVWDVYYNTLLVIEGAAPGAVVVTGADVWEDGWTARDDGRWEHAWPYEMEARKPWGDRGPEAPIAWRREMFFLNDTGLLQVLQHSHLAPGTFWIDEGSGRIVVHPPDTVDFASAVKEVSVRGGGTGALGVPARALSIPAEKEKVVVRNLTFEKFNIFMQDNAIVIEGNRVLLDNVVSRWHNSAGLNIGANDVSIRSSAFDDNGASGVVLWRAERVQFEASSTSRNNWRGNQGNYWGHAVGGVKAHYAEELTFSNHQAVGNWCAGLWVDLLCFDVLWDRVLVEDNWGPGILVEIAADAVIRDSVIRRNVPGIRVHSANNVHVANNLFENNHNHVNVYRDHRDFGSDQWLSNLNGLLWDKEPRQWSFVDNTFIAGDDAAWQAYTERRIPGWMRYTNPGYQLFFHFSHYSYMAAFFATATFTGNTMTHPLGATGFRNSEGMSVTPEAWYAEIRALGASDIDPLTTVQTMATEDSARELSPHFLLAMGIEGIRYDRELAYRDAIALAEPLEVATVAGIQTVIDQVNAQEDILRNPFCSFGYDMDFSREVSWFGRLWDEDWPVVYHEEHGWLSFLYASPPEFIAFNHRDRLGFVWFDQRTYPFLYSYDRESWLWYHEGGGKNGAVRWFYDFADATFFRLP